jgi:malonyl-CoA O-methyltransferase
MIDRSVARRRFSRAAASYAGASRLETEIGTRLLERLDYVRIQPRRMLDLGCGPAREAGALAARYPQALLLLLDFALPMLRRAHPAPGLLARFFAAPSALALCGDFERLPLAAASLQLVFSNMALHWAPQPLPVLREVHRALAEGGLFTFSTLGPDTLRELRAAAGAPRVHAFHDMHDLGDMLLAAGFSAPVMDMEQLTLLYEGPHALLSDLRASGQTCALQSRPRGLAGRAFGEALRAALARQQRDGRLPVSFEVVYGHAWKSAPRRAPEQPAVVRFEPRRAKN